MWIFDGEEWTREGELPSQPAAVEPDYDRLRDRMPELQIIERPMYDTRLPPPVSIVVPLPRVREDKPASKEIEH